MSDPVNNPYAAPTEVSQHDPYLAGNPDELAGRFTRFAAAMIDGILIMLVIMPIQFMSGYQMRAQTGELGIWEQLGMLAVSYVGMLLFQGYLLAKRGQTIGKWLCRIQIVGFPDRQQLPFIQIFVYRYMWTAPLSLIAIFIPGFIDEFLIGMLTLVDGLMIFRGDRRCLHDMIAKSQVVLYRPAKERIDVVDLVKDPG